MAQPVRTAVLMFLLPGLLLPLAAADAVQRNVRSGARIEMKLEAGDYEILPGDGETLSVTITGPRSERVRVHLDGSDAHARLAVTHTHHSSFRAVIKVPKTCDLVVRHSAGDLRIGAIRGHKDLRTHAGNLEVQVGDPNDYAHVNATVTAGDLDAKPFHRTEGGLFNSLRWTGPGKYELRAKLMAGDLILK